MLTKQSKMRSQVTLISSLNKGGSESLPRFLEEDAIIQEKGVHEIRKIYPGGHDWNVWRPCFTDFAQMIFR